MTRSDQLRKCGKNSVLMRRLLMLVMTTVTIAATTLVWAGVHPGIGSKTNLYDLSGVQERAGNDRDADWDDHDADHRRENYAIGLWGDLPYSDVQVQGVLNLIDDMNSQNLAFTVHDGDLKAGKGGAGSVTPTTCADAKYVQALSFFFRCVESARRFHPWR